MTTIGALLLLAGLLWAWPAVLALCGPDEPDEGRVSEGWVRRQR
jgi:hypothetical protein